MVELCGFTDVYKWTVQSLARLPVVSLQLLYDMLGWDREPLLLSARHSEEQLKLKPGPR